MQVEIKQITLQMLVKSKEINNIVVIICGFIRGVQYTSIHGTPCVELVCRLHLVPATPEATSATFTQAGSDIAQEHKQLGGTQTIYNKY